MPCYYTGSAEGDARLAAEEASKALTKATRAACDMARLLRQYGILNGYEMQFGRDKSKKLKPATLKWIKEHAKVDAKRKSDGRKRKTRKV